MCNGTHEDNESVGTILLQLVDELVVQVAFAAVPPTPHVIEPVDEEEEEAVLYGKHASKLSCTVCRLNVA